MVIWKSTHILKKVPMAKIEATIPDKLKEDLEWLAAETGQTLSSTIADCLELGRSAKADNLNKFYTLKSMSKRLKAAEEE